MKTTAFNTFQKFFDTKGLTSTSANYIANIAKELVKTSTPNMTFVDVYISDWKNQDHEHKIKSGISEKDFELLDEIYEQNAKLHALIAWLREAIKAKENMLNVIEKTNIEEWAEENGIDMMNFTLPKWDKDYDYNKSYTENDYINEHLSIKEVNEYLYLNAICSVLGKTIHPGGEYSQAKDEISNKIDESYVQDYNSEVIVYKYKSSIPVEKINSKFFELQAKERDYQKRLNKIKFEIENGVQAENEKRKTEYLKWKEEVKKVEAEQAAVIAGINSQFWKWKNDKLAEIRSMKIVIPNDLEDIYQLVNNYGK